MSERLVPEHARKAMALIGTVAAFGGGVALANTLHAAPASADTLTETSPTSSDQCYSEFDMNRPPGPQRGCWNPKEDTDVQVRICQEAVTNPHKGLGLIESRKFKRKTGSTIVQVNENLNRLQVWSGNLFMYACAEVTSNSVKEQLVRRAKPHSKKVHNIGKSVVVKADNSTTFDGNRIEIKHTSRRLHSPKTTVADFHHRLIGVRDTVTSVPKIQVPYHDPDNPFSDIPGPMKTVRRQHITWLR